MEEKNNLFYFVKGSSPSLHGLIIHNIWTKRQKEIRWSALLWYVQNQCLHMFSWKFINIHLYNKSPSGGYWCKYNGWCSIMRHQRATANKIHRQCHCLRRGAMVLLLQSHIHVSHFNTPHPPSHPKMEHIKNEIKEQKSKKKIFTHQLHHLENSNMFKVCTAWTHANSSQLL